MPGQEFGRQQGRLGAEGPLASRVGFSPGGKSLIAALSGS